MRRCALALCALLPALAAPLAAQREGAALPRWWSNGTCYEIFVRSFQDSDGDGVGDLRGLTQRLDYINDGDPSTRGDLGARCIWLMPMAESPSYHGYDVTDYYAVDREYGTREDFQALVAEAHRRGIRVLVDLVLNHTSSRHPFFQSALSDPASPHRDWYLWSPVQRHTRGWSVPTWHRAGERGAWYYGLFWSGMPDLNLASPGVTEEWRRVARFWLREMGVDGFRLDAVGHFFENGDDPRHGPGTHPWLAGYQAYIQTVKPGAFTVGEVWDSTGALAAYYPDQLDAYFAFEVSDALLEAVRTGSRHRLVSALERVQRTVPEGRWGAFQRNHDQTRTLTELGGDVRRARLAASLLLTLPGIPFVYYGEEIGMQGSKPDERLRTPMHWVRGPAAGFTRGVPWQPLQADSLAANVQAQEGDPASLLNHYRRLIHLRHATPALGSAAAWIPLDAGPGAALAYLRREGGQTVLVVANLGETRLSDVALSSAAAVLPAGRYAPRTLLGGATPPALRVGSDGRIDGWIPLPALEPFEAHVLELSSAR